MESSHGVTTLLALFLLASAAGAIDVPAAPMPTIDGDVAEAEWQDAVKIENEAGTARLQVADRVLCIALEMRRPYGGERIDLLVAEADGPNWTWHALHPACAIPPKNLLPIAPVLVRRASFSTRDKAPIDPPRACLFRARVYENGQSWSAEIALGLQALDVSPFRRIGFQLNVLHPAGDRGMLQFVPGTPDPRTWTPLVARWPQVDEPFMTKAENARRAFELRIFKEILDISTQRAPRDPVFGAALVRKKNNARIRALHEKLQACVDADPGDFFARVNLVHLLRRANRLEEAEAASAALRKQFPFAKSDPAALNADRALLFAQGRFREALRLPLPGQKKKSEDLIEAWDEEGAARHIEDPEAPRIVFETTKGRIVVKLHERAAPRSVAHVLALVRAGHYDGASFDDVTGGVGAQVTAKKPCEKRLPLEESKRRAWRGSLALVWEGGSAGADLKFLTGHGTEGAVGRVIEGMEFVDALEAGDRIDSARVARP